MAQIPPSSLSATERVEDAGDTSGSTIVTPFLTVAAPFSPLLLKRILYLNEIFCETQLPGSISLAVLQPRILSGFYP